MDETKSHSQASKYDKEEILQGFPFREFYNSELSNIKWNGKEGKVQCCFHDDKQPSLSINVNTGMFHCFGCDASGDVFTFYMKKHDLDFSQALKRIGEYAGVSSPRKRGGRGFIHSQQKHATTQQDKQPTNYADENQKNAQQQCCNVAATSGVTLTKYAESKKLPLEFLKKLGCRDITYEGSPAFRIPYYNRDSNEISVRFRVCLGKSPDGQDNRFRFKKGCKPCLYGQQFDFKENYRILVEGESDCHSLWLNGFPTVGIPGATQWNNDRDAHYFDGVETIFIVIEPDEGGEALKKILSRSTIKDRARIVSLKGFKDSSEMYLDNPDQFRVRMQEALDNAVPWTDIEQEKDEEERKRLWEICKVLATQNNIPDIFISDLRLLGVEGEEYVAKTLFLALVSRYLDRPISAIVKGQSAGGKSFVVQETSKFFPSNAYLTMTDMSARALAFTDEPLEHRFIILYEAAGLSTGGKENEGDDQTKNYFIRSLLSEGCIDYYVTVKGKDGYEGRKIHKDGPTGLILTTTKIRLHPENETRYMSFTINDTPEQTSNILKAIARKEEGEQSEDVDFERWHSLQDWLNLGNHKVYIPYAKQLADEIPPVAVRLRRDFTLLLNLIKAHAILHQASREVDDRDRIVATVDDYAVVRELVSGVLSEGVGATVDKRIREVVVAVENILSEGNEHATMQQVEKMLHLHKSTVSRRVAQALSSGYLVNADNKNRKPYKLILGEPLPDEVEILPPPENIGCCKVACNFKEYTTTPPSPSEEDDFIHEEDEEPTPLHIRGTSL